MGIWYYGEDIGLRMPRQEGDETSEHARHAFSVRIPTELFDKLKALKADEGASINSLIEVAVAKLVDRPDLEPTVIPDDTPTAVAAAAIRNGPTAVGPLKSMASAQFKRGQAAVGIVLSAVAARVLATTDPVAASADLARTGNKAWSAKKIELAAALWEEALGLDPNNVEAANRYGQYFHGKAQRSAPAEAGLLYKRGEELLREVTFLDNRAKLFHGWCALHVADGDPVARHAALAEIEEALKAWAFGARSVADRAAWLAQVERLRWGHLELANSLIDFANARAQWGDLDQLIEPGSYADEEPF